MTPTPEVRILMADDDPAQLMLSEAALAGAGFLVQTVCDGADAVEQFERVAPDLVVLDVNMPRLSGIDACRNIRRMAGGRSLPILMLTGRNDIQAISDAFAAGASDFAQKGINPRLLVERVRFLLRDRSLQAELSASRSKLLLAQRIARVGHWELATDGRTLHVSPMLGEILGVDPQVLGSFEDFVSLLDPAEQFEARQAFIACATGGGRYSRDHSFRTPAGDEVSMHQEAELVAEADHGGGGTIIVTLQDLTRLHRAEEAVRRLSYHDAATGLPNRRSLVEQVDAALADRSGVAATGLVAFRVHHLEHVTQAQGAGAADAVLARIARRLEAELAAVSDGGIVPWRSATSAVCRTADAQLALLLRSRLSEQNVADLARRMLAALAADPVREEDGYVPALSAGVACAGERDEGDSLLQRAHVAAEFAASPWTCEVYSPLPLARTRRRLQAESALRGAVDRGELHLAYQPRVRLGDYAVQGVECLARWEHPQFGTVPPGEFIAIAESAGMIVDIGRWVLAEACRQMAVWRRRFEADISIAVNLSGRQLLDPGLVEFVQKTLERNGLPAPALELEITESSVVQSPADARRVLDTLRAIGVRIAIDDFGAGSSSLGQLRRLPFDSLKLDRSLMSDLYTDLGAQGVTTAVIAMARSLRVRSVAEGVEDPGTLDMLVALGCDEVQGNLVSAPLGPRELEDWIEDGGAAALARESTIDVVDALEAVERRAFAARLD
jgi:EAL domain-containing protein (putative c-di-GMP-specific phosphodiesterase class I)/DNA-binding response OmpR family regulator/GGDEF domain-containing protein